MDAPKPRVNIGVPVYNAEQFIEESLDALLAQTFTDFELIICDNASTDRTQEICLAYAAKDRRVRYHRNLENIGAAGNFNKVFKLSDSEYFKWASYDDICAPTFLERCVEVLDREPSVVLCHPKANNIDETGKPIKIYESGDLNLRFAKPYERLSKFFEINGWHHPNQWYGLIRTSALKVTPLHGNYDTSDRVFLAGLVLLGEFYELPECLFSRRVHKKNPTNLSQEDLAAWFDPKNLGKITFPMWRRYFEYCKTILKAPIPWDEKVRCYGEILRLALLSAKSRERLGSLVEDVTKASRNLLGRFYLRMKESRSDTKL